MLPGPGGGCVKGYTTLSNTDLSLYKPCYFQSLTLLKNVFFFFFSLKVTGKKVYAAGNWSKAAVSSLFTPKPQELVPKETAAPQFNSHEAVTAEIC